MYKQQSIWNEREFTLDGIETLWIYSCNRDVYLYHTEAENLLLKENYGKHSEAAVVERREDALCLEVSKREWRVQIGIHDSRFHTWGTATMEIHVPKGFAGQIYVGTAGGDVFMRDDWKLENLQMQVGSGDISLGNIGARHILLEAKHGDVEVESFMGDLKCSVFNGDIAIKHGRGRQKLESVSGDILTVLIPDCHSLSAHTTSGDIRVVAAAECVCRIKATAGSGDVRATVAGLQVTEQRENRLIGMIGMAKEGKTPAEATLSAASGDIILTN